MKIRAATLLIVFLTQPLAAGTTVKLAKATGDVKIRRGVEESWQPASAGTVLEEIDSILTGEGARVSLEMQTGKIFVLGSNAILDIADLRKISERELFLLLMSKKIENIEPREEKTKLRIGDVNVVHGEQKTGEDSPAGGKSRPESWLLEKNGALALLQQAYTTNAILKLNKILAKYPDMRDCGEMHFYLAQAFERLNKTGQAVEAYQVASDQEACGAAQSKWGTLARQALQRLGQ